MNRTHLYPGFRYAGSLPSVRCQREVQARLLRQLEPRNLLTVGCAYGEELCTLLPVAGMSDPRLNVTATDLCDVEHHLRAHRFVIDLGPRLRWAQIDLLDLERLPGYGKFDFVQCGFVLHDIPPNAKDRAIQVLARAAHPSGYLLISDIFVRRCSEYASEISEIYDAFLGEARACLESGALDEHGWRLLVGDGQSPGLLRSKEEALCGSRDFLETLPGLLRRAKGCGLEINRIMRNKVNDRLAVLLLRTRDSFPADSRASTIRGGTDVQ